MLSSIAVSGENFKYPPFVSLDAVAELTPDGDSYEERQLQTKTVALIEMTVGLLALCYLFTKATINQDPDKNEDEEARDAEGSVKHQFWQTLDWQM